MSNVDLIEMKIPAKAEYVGVIRLTLSGIANRIGFSYEEIEDIKVAISEAITNSITHGGVKEGEGEITISFGVYEDRLEIMVADDGESFQLNEVKSKIGPYKKSESMEDLREGGFGLFLIEVLMDKVQINNGLDGVTVLMTKYLNGVGVDLDDDQVSSQS